ncbi:MAG: hypothetical protein U9Q05_10495 [Thermodesulfobacteriota bacterium]|nr:hypothetical protein [Thermodesulfobacteriota bacterium]
MARNCAGFWFGYKARQWFHTGCMRPLTQRRSRAKRQARWGNLFFSRPLLHWKEEKAIIGALFDIGMEYDVIFSPLFTFSDEWEKGIFTEFPVYQEITQDGVAVL